MSSRRFARFARLAPLAAVTAAGCFATRNDVRLLQLDIARLQHSVDSAHTVADVSLHSARAAQVRTDSALAASQRQLLIALGLVSDSVRILSDQFGKFRAVTTDDLYELGQQQIRIFALQGATQKQLADMQAANDTRRETGNGAAAGATKGGAADTSARSTMPGPAKMYQDGLAQLRLGRSGTARQAFEDLLAQYPDYTNAADALVHLAETYAMDGNDATADSLYQSVVERYPKSAAAPAALFKRADALVKAGQARKGADLYNQIISDYPNSDQVVLAKDRLKTLKIIPPL